MALEHAVSGEPWSVQPFGAAIGLAQSSALFKSKQLEVIRLVLLAGKSLPPHKVSGEITVQCIEGELAIDAHGSTQRLPAGQIAFLAGGEMHAVTALQDSSALLTIVLAGSERAA